MSSSPFYEYEQLILQAEQLIAGLKTNPPKSVVDYLAVVTQVSALYAQAAAIAKANGVSQEQIDQAHSTNQQVPLDPVDLSLGGLKPGPDIVTHYDLVEDAIAEASKQPTGSYGVFKVEGDGKQYFLIESLAVGPSVGNQVWP